MRKYFLDNSNTDFSLPYEILSVSQSVITALLTYEWRSIVITEYVLGMLTLADPIPYYIKF